MVRVSAVSSTSLSRIFMFFSLCVSLFMVMIGVWIIMSRQHQITDYDYIDDIGDIPFSDTENVMYGRTQEGIVHPIILWWTPFTGEIGRARTCGNERCFFSNNRNYFNHSQLKVLMFYGSILKAADLPIPREPHHEWALLHEESPKNNYIFSHASIMTLFNHTSTFKRESDFPLTTQSLLSLDWLSSTKYLVPVSDKNKLRQSGLALISYTQSDCDTESDRDSYVKFVMELINVDSYGACLHNKDLPSNLVNPIEGMEHEDFYRIQAQYKFAFAFENGICDDYVTEKLWRTLHVGSVPVIHGSPKIKDLLPPHSAIIISDFESIQSLVDYLKYLDTHDDEYYKYLAWKHDGIDNPYLKSLLYHREWGIDNNDLEVPNFIDSFECFVCRRIHENIKLKENGEPTKSHIATIEHYGCPRPLKFDSTGKRLVDITWGWLWDNGATIAKSVRYLVDKNVAYDGKKLHEIIKMNHE